MTRLLMTADAVGGVWPYALDLASALGRHDIGVELAVMGPPMSDAQRHAVAASAVQRVHEAAFALEWMPDPWDDVDRAGDWLLGVAAEVRPDVAHLNGYVHAALPWRVPTVVVAHSDVVSWWRAVHRSAPPPQWSTYAARVRAGLDAADAVVAPTTAVLNDLEQSFGHRGGVVVPNCRSSGWVIQRPKERLALAAGRAWDDAKNIAVVERAAGRTRWPVAIAGGDVATTAPDDRPRRLGGLAFPELADWLLRAAVFLAPARYEPFGLGALEAALAGCALVLGDIPSLREVWADAAVYVDPDDGDALVALLDRLWARPSTVERLGDRARARAATYQPATTAAGYLDVYARLLATAVPA